MTHYIAAGISPVQLRSWLVQSKELSGEDRKDVIIKVVCEYFNVEYYDLTTNSRKREFVEPRMICMYLIRKHTKISLKPIGRLFGNRDHSTVIYASETVKDLIATNFKFSQNVRNIEKLI